MDAQQCEVAASSVALARAQVALIAAFLGKTEARDKIVRTIQYGSKAISAGEKGPLLDLEKHASMARKLFRLAKSVNDLQQLLAPAPRDQPAPIVLLTRAKHGLLGTYFALDAVLWAGRVGVYKNKDRAELLGRISVWCWMGANYCTIVTELSQLAAKRRGDRARYLALLKACLDVVTAFGILQLGQSVLKPRLQGVIGLISSLISCYQVYPAQPAPALKAKAA
eukprot:jgi/Chlat1/1116/Chrsp111S01601